MGRDKVSGRSTTAVLLSMQERDAAGASSDPRERQASNADWLAGAGVRASQESAARQRARCFCRNT